MNMRKHIVEKSPPAETDDVNVLTQENINRVAKILLVESKHYELRNINT